MTLIDCKQRGLMKREKVFLSTIRFSHCLHLTSTYKYPIQVRYQIANREAKTEIIYCSIQVQRFSFRKGFPLNADDAWNFESFTVIKYRFSSFSCFDIEFLTMRINEYILGISFRVSCAERRHLNFPNKSFIKLIKNRKRYGNRNINKKKFWRIFAWNCR